jgi:hypothetical protein
MMFNLLLGVLLIVFLAVIVGRIQAHAADARGSAVIDPLVASQQVRDIEAWTIRQMQWSADEAAYGWDAVDGHASDAWAGPDVDHSDWDWRHQ